MDKQADKHEEKIERTKLLAIWALKRMEISYRAIGRLFSCNHETVAEYYKIACEKIDMGELSALPKGQKFRREIYVGDSTDIEGLYAEEYQRPTGGGWRTNIRRSEEKDNHVA